MTPYRPSNGDEGEWFVSRYCDNCHYDEKYRQTGDGRYGCKIIGLSMGYDIGDPYYPKELVEDESGPCCTKFKPPVKRERHQVKKHRLIKGQGILL